MVDISSSVGDDGTNLVPDVVAIKSLLNQCAAAIGRTGPLAPGGICDPATVQAIYDFQRKVMKRANADGRIDAHGGTLKALNICASTGRYVPDGLYTANPMEVPTQTTRPTIAQMIQMLRAKWPALNLAGAKVLTAQSMAETGDWRFCFNWNLGNAKGVKDQLHMYLRFTWECYAAADAAKQVANSGGLAHLATVAEAKSRGWSCPKKVVVAFDPPHDQCRFKAYATLEEGAEKWLGYHMNRAAKDSAYLPALLAGDIATVVHSLAKAGYFTADEGEYRRGMEAKMTVIDATLGSAAAVGR